MPQTLRADQYVPPRKGLSIRSLEGETVGKILSDDDAKREHGRIFARTLELAGLTPQDVQHFFSYANQTPISKWSNGLENPPIHHLLQMPKFAPAYIVAISERTGHAIDVETTLRVRLA